METTALRLTGKDVLSLLHNISTQALVDLAPGRARATSFCDFRGRLLHRAVVAATTDGAVWLLRDDAPGSELAAFLDRHVFREDVKIEDLSSTWAVIRAETNDRPDDIMERGGIPERVRAGDGTALRVESTPSGSNDFEAHERRRVLAGRPAHGHEIAEAFTPFEVGLERDVYLDKGCFPGQEALRRLITYKSVRRHLASVRGDGAPPTTPADLMASGEKAGVLTSAVREATGGWIGLAVVRRDLTGGLTLAGGERVEVIPS